MPTYNYGRFIGAAIESIRAQGQKDLEVVVLDGGSTDETRAVVERAAAVWPAVRYVRQDRRGGIDADLARSVELATGEYCWLLSADDVLQIGAATRILSQFESGNDIVLCNRIWCDSHLKPVHVQSWLKGDAADRTVDLSGRLDVLSYLESAQSLGALFSFMSCIGFRREAWLHAESPAGDVPCYAHVGRLFAMGRAGARLKYLAEPLVLCRGGTDSFTAGGLTARLLIDLRGYMQLALALFPDDKQCRRAFLAVMKQEHPIKQWIEACLETPQRAQWQEVESELAGYGLTAWQLCLIRASSGGIRLARAIASRSHR